MPSRCRGVRGEEPLRDGVESLVDGGARSMGANTYGGGQRFGGLFLLHRLSSRGEQPSRNKQDRNQRCQKDKSGYTLRALHQFLDPTLYERAHVVPPS